MHDFIGIISGIWFLFHLCIKDAKGIQLISGVA